MADDSRNTELQPAERPTPDVAARLLALNRAFYAEAGAAFDTTRQDLPPGMRRAVQAAPPARPGHALRVLDVGCGNGRFARALAALGRPVTYTGLDADAGLLAAAAEQTAPLEQAAISCHFAPIDLALDGWANSLPAEGFDLVVCLATLHHLPGLQLRTQVVRTLAALVAPGGRLLISAWQFAGDSRLAGRVEPWAAIGLRDEDVAPGDVLLPWESGPRALRYVHSIDGAEMDALAEAAGACGLALLATWRSDGRSNDLALYCQMGREPHPTAPNVPARIVAKPWR